MPKITTKLTLPKYATAPSSPVAGDMFLNTTTDTIDVHDGTNWLSLNSKLTIVTYTAGSYTWTRPETVEVIDTVVGLGAGGGGGAGLLRVNTVTGFNNGAGGGGSGSVGLIRGLYVGNISTISIFVATGGSGGIAATYAKASGVVGDTSLVTPATPANPSATTFGSYLNLGAGTPGLSSSTRGVGAFTRSSTVYGAVLSNGSTGGTGAAGAAVNGGSDGGASPLASYSSFNGLTAASGNPGSALTNSSSGISTTVYTIPGTGLATGSGGSSAIGGGGGGASGGSGSTGRGPSGSGGSGGGGGAGGSIGFASITAASGVTLSASAGNGGAAAAAGAGGGGGGTIYAMFSSAATYQAATVNISSGAGGAGGDGLIIIAYQG
jgi:hypothetical protein